jgi:hypothetical protein
MEGLHAMPILIRPHLCRDSAPPVPRATEGENRKTGAGAKVPEAGASRRKPAGTLKPAGTRVCGPVREIPRARERGARERGGSCARRWGTPRV